VASHVAAMIWISVNIGGSRVQHYTLLDSLPPARGLGLPPLCLAPIGKVSRFARTRLYKTARCKQSRKEDKSVKHANEDDDDRGPENVHADEPY